MGGRRPGGCPPAQDLNSGGTVKTKTGGGQGMRGGGRQAIRGLLPGPGFGFGYVQSAPPEFSLSAVPVFFAGEESGAGEVRGTLFFSMR